jgi:cytochrome c biogenesis protein CcdA
MDRDKELKKIKSAQSLTFTLGILSVFFLVLIGLLAVPAMLASSNSQTPAAVLGIALVMCALIYLAVTVYFFMMHSRIKKALPDDLAVIEKTTSNLFITTLVLAILSFSSILGLIIFGFSAYYFYQAKEAARNLMADQAPVQPTQPTQV